MATRISSYAITSSTPPEKISKKLSPAEYVSQSWIPISEKVLSRVKQRSEHDFYSQEPKTLIHDLKQDLGLFTWFLRHLPEIQAEESEEDGRKNISADKIPGQITQNIDWSKFKSQLSKINSKNMPHSLQGSLKIQSSVLKHAVISATTAEAVAAHNNVPPELAHLCGSIRHLGFNLIAWNYPTIFSKAVANCPDKAEEVSKELKKFLGCSPAALAASVCLDWDKSKRLKSFVIENNTQTLAAPSLETVSNSFAKSSQYDSDQGLHERLNNCLEIGDAMAYLSDPEHFPGYAKNWQTTVTKLEHFMGKNALSEIEDKLSGFADIYSTDETEFKVALEPRKNMTQTSIFRVTDRLMSGNTAISRCPEEIKNKFRKIYSAIDKRSVSTSAINLLISELLPSLGFMRGCLYRFDEKAFKLTPLLRIGETSLDKFEVLNCNHAKHMKHPAVMATCFSNPVIQEDIFINNEAVSIIAGQFGESKKKAVLYVQLSKKLNSDQAASLINFKAIQKTISDCLNFD